MANVLSGNVLGGAAPAEMRSFLPILAWHAVPGLAATLVDSRNTAAWQFADNAAQCMDTSIFLPDEWVGEILTLDVLLTQAAAGNGNVRIRASATWLRVGRVAPVNQDLNIYLTKAVSGTGYSPVLASFDLSMVEAQIGDCLGLRFTRFGADALDTWAGPINVWGTNLYLG